MTCIAAQIISYRVKRKVSGSVVKRSPNSDRGQRGPLIPFFMFQHADGEERPWDVSQLGLEKFPTEDTRQKEKPCAHC